jgi:hypothetical protein
MIEKRKKAKGPKSRENESFSGCLSLGFKGCPPQKDVTGGVKVTAFIMLIR